MGGSGQRWRWRRSSGCRTGCCTHHAALALRGLGDSVWDTPPSPIIALQNAGSWPCSEQQLPKAIKFNYANASESGGLVPAPSAGSVQGCAGLGSFSGTFGGRVWVGQPSLGGGSLQPATCCTDVSRHRYFGVNPPPKSRSPGHGDLIGPRAQGR